MIQQSSSCMCLAQSHSGNCHHCPLSLVRFESLLWARCVCIQALVQLLGRVLSVGVRPGADAGCCSHFHGSWAVPIHSRTSSLTPRKKTHLLWAQHFHGLGVQPTTWGGWQWSLFSPWRHGTGMVLPLCRVSWLKGAGLGPRVSCPLQHFPLKKGRGASLQRPYSS